MALFTGKGDDGTTKTLDSKDRISKSSAIAEALGSLDEVNSFLGLCKVHPDSTVYCLLSTPLSSIVHQIQEDLFIVQAELAGADKTIEERKVKEMEEKINTIEKEMPPIKSFFISGGVELAALFDIARTMARRAERRVRVVVEEGERPVGIHTKAFLNRLSSLLYALARYSNHLAGIKEKAPEYR